MWRRSLLAGLLAAVAFIAAQQVVVAPEASAAAPVRVMPLGDSITGSPGCWRATLWNRLQSSGLTDVDFVGTLPPQGCGVAYDGDNEGHGGFLATNVADQNQLVGWLAATRPDVVMMHFGTNDVWSNRSNDVILAAFAKLVDQMRASNPSMRILVAKIIPMGTSQCPECGQRVVSFNNAIPAWAAGKTTSQSPITVVDQWTGFDTATDTYDGVHPNAAGDQKMSDKWYPALAAALGGVTPTTGPPTTAPPTTAPPTTAPPTTAPPTTTPPRAGCVATYRAVGQWPGGFQGEVTVRNAGSATTNGWTVRLTFANGQAVSQMWGGSYTQSGSTVTVTNAGYNGAIGPNASATFGFIASWTGTNTAPTLTCTAT
ncbi:cellulose binding domain-containing protein [Phytohabitans sp. ZYX-F-186]|uniref:Cellulose binding domain-containing protein n=1 Tax=Phytohabitans maris TaxID=3071409 RepID=A0ABU0ZQE1_9ACTN|nr:cellulose binding domain-containing protein [Phytohabitans sp. ZYX-F-186]MDQ7909240.1 cellulose binding domain-containing protein [Phytohabitans sp. ZYX-F-186]